MKNRVVWLGGILLCAIAVSISGCGKTEADKVEAMNVSLEKKRALLEIATTALPEAQKAVDAAVGYSLPIEMDWDSMAVYDVSYLTVDRVTSYGLKPVIDGLTAVAKDATGKKALAARLTKIHIVGKPASESSDRATTLFVKDGTLNLRQGFDGNGVWDADSIRECLEKSL